MKDGAFLPYVVPVKGRKWKKFQKPRKDIGVAQVLFLLFSFYLDSCSCSSLSDYF